MQYANPKKSHQLKEFLVYISLNPSVSLGNANEVSKRRLHYSFKNTRHKVNCNRSFNEDVQWSVKSLEHLSLETYEVLS